MLPFASTAVYGYKIYREDITTTFEAIIHAHHQVMLPLERIQDIFWQLSAELIDYSQEGEADHRISFEESTKAAQVQLSEMRTAISDNSRYAAIFHDVQLHWDRVLKVMPRVVKGKPTSADTNLIVFENEISQAAQRVGQLAEELRIESEEAHQNTLKAIKRLEAIALIAAILAVVFAVATIFAIDRVLINSTDKLVEGAMRVASGDREQEINVQVPPELASVAQAFNTMIRQILRQETQLRLAAQLDGLTGLKNRREFELRIVEHINPNKTKPGSFALLMIDVDHFKLFNDTHGHLAGDDALRHIAEVLSTTARETDEVFRYGGEEFAVLLSDIRQDQVFPTAERIRSEVEKAHFLLPNGDHESITVSIGAAGLASGFSFNDIVEQADKALYQAKVAGRNKVIIAKS